MSAHEGVSCDACGKSNFRSKRFKCLICYDYDLCATCHDQGEASSNHTAEHPMQCILTRQDFDLYYHGERYTSEQPQSLTCPFCGDMGFAFPYLNESSSSSNNSTQNVDLFQHLQLKHADEQQSAEVICPICAAMINGEPNLVTTDLLSHIANDHQISQVTTPSTAGVGPSTYLRQSLTSRDYDFGIGNGIRGGFRRGSLRAPVRRGTNGSGRGGGPVSQHFVVDPASPLSGGGNDPIADLLTQLSTVRRLAAANNNTGTNTNNSLPPSANTVTLQTLTRQQYERERLRAAARSHHHHSQQSTSSSNLVPSSENDFFDTFFSSALLIDPTSSSPNNHHGWTHILGPAQPIPDQQSQPSSTSKTPATTNTESDHSFLRQICDESALPSSSSQQNTTNIQSSKQKIDFVQSLLFSSFAHLSSDK